ARQESPGAVDMTLYDVAAEPTVGTHRPLQVDQPAGFDAVQAGALQRLGDDIDGELVIGGVHNGQAHAVDRDRISVPRVLCDHRTPHGEPRGLRVRLHARDLAKFLDNPGEHL